VTQVGAVFSTRKLEGRFQLVTKPSLAAVSQAVRAHWSISIRNFPLRIDRRNVCPETVPHHNSYKSCSRSSPVQKARKGVAAGAH
jgi:hypothetical protein